MAVARHWDSLFRRGGMRDAWVVRYLASREWQIIVRAPTRARAMEAARSYVGPNVVVMSWASFARSVLEKETSRCATK